MLRLSVGQFVSTQRGFAMLTLDMDTDAMLHCSLFLCCLIAPQIPTRDIWDIAEVWDIWEMVYGPESSVEL